MSHQAEQEASASRVVRRGLLEVHVTARDGRHTVAAVGELDRSAAPLLDEAMLEAEATSARQIVLDLSALEFMDSSGLYLILEAHARSQADSNRLSIVRGPRRVQRVFEITHTETLLPFTRTPGRDSG